MSLDHDSATAVSNCRLLGLPWMGASGAEVIVGCRKSCGLCVPGSETTTSAGQESTQTSSTTKLGSQHQGAVHEGNSDVVFLLVLLLLVVFASPGVFPL